MSRRFVLRASNSALTGGADFNKDLADFTDTATSITVAVAHSSTETSYGFTQADIPGTGGATGNYTVEINVTTAHTNMFCKVAVGRVNSSGVLQGSESADSAEQQLNTTGVKTFTLTSVNLGSWAVGDRLRVAYRFRSNKTSGPVASVVIQTSTSDTEVLTPFAVPPYLVDGVEPEAHGHCPPMLDGNGNLYRVTESFLVDNNQTKMMKSSDGGQLWAEQDAANRPGLPSSILDLEAGWQWQDSTNKTIFFMWEKGDSVRLVRFLTSDHPSAPDTWGNAGARETVVASTIDPGSNQYASIVQTSNGNIWCFYQSAVSGANYQIGYKQRTAFDTYGAESTAVGGSTSTSWTSPVCCLGASDVTHIFYCDKTSSPNQLRWRTLTAAGVLSGATRVDVNGTHTIHTPLTNPVYYDNSGTEIITVAFTNTSAILKAVTITGGTPGSEETISTAAVLQDPANTTSRAAIAHLAVDTATKTVYAIWSDSATGNVLYSKRAHGGSWDTPVTLQTLSGTDQNQWVYNAVYTRSGTKYMGYTYDRGLHLDDDSDIFFAELTLPSGTTATPAVIAATVAVPTPTIDNGAPPPAAPVLNVLTSSGSRLA